jgi:hypothetical protein
MRLLIGLVLCLGLKAQTLIDVQAITTAALSQITVLQSVTGTDGTVCTLSKVTSKTIYGYFNCTNGLKTVQLIPVGTTSATYWPLGGGGQFWLIAANPTTAIVNFGSLGNVPVNGMVWNATGNGTTLVSGQVTWP